MTPNTSFLIRFFRPYLSVFSVLIFLGLSACQQPPITAQKVHWVGEAQGTYYAITYWDSEGRNFRDSIELLLKKFDLVASNWEPLSEINAINDNKTTKVSPMFADLFEKSEAISRLTDGAFDITVGPLVKAYGFLFSKREPMTETHLDSLRTLVGWQKVRIENGHLIKSHPAIRIDFNAIAQGYSSDLIGQFLDRQGIHDYLIDVGGEVLAHGSKPQGEPWMVGIEKPTESSDGQRELQAKIRLKDASIVTSGTYRKYYEEKGKRFSHAIDPHTGRPVTHSLLSVAVLDSCSWRADALATALLVMGTEKALDFISRHPGMDAYFIYADAQGRFQTILTPGMQTLATQP